MGVEMQDMSEKKKKKMEIEEKIITLKNSQSWIYLKIYLSIKKMLPIQRKPHCQNIYMKNPSSAVLILCLSFRGAAWGEFLSVFVSGEDFLWGRIFSGGIVTREEFLGGGTQHINKMRQEISETGDGGKVLTRTDHMLLMRRLVSEELGWG